MAKNTKKTSKKGKVVKNSIKKVASKKIKKKVKVKKTPVEKTQLSRDSIYRQIYPARKRLSPTKISRLFWDFYALELLYNSFKVNPAISFARQVVVEKELIEIVKILLPKMVSALEASVRGEVRYFFRAFRRRNTNDGCTYFKDKILESIAEKRHPLTIDLEEIQRIFVNQNIWGGDYGGPSWAKATRVLIQAKKDLEKFDLVQWTLRIDRIFDLHHNSGFILNKTDFSSLENDELDRRHDIDSLESILDPYNERFVNLTPKIRTLLKTFVKKK